MLLCYLIGTYRKLKQRNNATLHSYSDKLDTISTDKEIIKHSTVNTTTIILFTKLTMAQKIIKSILSEKCEKKTEIGKPRSE